MPDYKILIVDYDPRSAQHLRETLETAGYGVEIAKDGAAGIEAFHRVRPAMAFIEAMLPKKHGFEVCQELKQSAHGEKTPIVIVTNVYKGRKYRTLAFHQHRCDEYLEKPIAPDKLLEVVERFLKPPSVPEPEPEPEDAPARPAARAGADDNAEIEIMERLDEILPDMNSGNGDSVVVSFDPARSRQRQTEVASAGGSAAMSSRGGSSTAALDPATAPEEMSATAANPMPMRVSDSAPLAAPSGARRKTGWIWIALCVALIAGIALIFLFLPH